MTRSVSSPLRWTSWCSAFLALVACHGASRLNSVGSRCNGDAECPGTLICKANTCSLPGEQGEAGAGGGSSAAGGAPGDAGAGPSEAGAGGDAAGGSAGSGASNTGCKACACHPDFTCNGELICTAETVCVGASWAPGSEADSELIWNVGVWQ